MIFPLDIPSIYTQFAQTWWNDNDDDDNNNNNNNNNGNSSSSSSLFVSLVYKSIKDCKQSGCRSLGTYKAAL